MSPHGTFARWMEGCLCDLCFAAQRRVTEARKPGKSGHPLTGRTHGLRSTYNDGCHCRKCGDADLAYQAARREANRAEYNRKKNEYNRSKRMLQNA